MATLILGEMLRVDSRLGKRTLRLASAAAAFTSVERDSFKRRSVGESSVSDLSCALHGVDLDGEVSP
jgi:hypothetical protein